MKVAVLMSTYNGSHYINKQLQSIFYSTFIGELHVYIRDDGSTDQTNDIIKKWQCRIPISVIEGQNIGPALSFWKLIADENIQADYYFLCDQDDIWDSDKIGFQISYMQGHDEQLSISNCRIIDKYDHVLQEKRVNVVNEVKLENLFVSGVAQGCSMAFTDKFIKLIRKCKITCIPMHDIILLMYAVLNGGVLWIDRPLFSYRVHNNNVIANNQKSTIKKITSLFKNWKNCSDNSVTRVAEELLANNDAIPQDKRDFLELVCRYKSSLSNRFRLAYSKNINWDNPYIMRSFRIRVLLGIL